MDTDEDTQFDDGETLSISPIKNNNSLVSARECQKLFEDDLLGNTFVSLHPDKGMVRWKFRILALGNPGNQIGFSKLHECIKRGGGEIADVDEDSASTGNNHVIQILDVEYIRNNVRNSNVLDRLIPYDCFNSNFIWSQVYILQGKNNENVDLNMFRISPSGHASFDANLVLRGVLSWKNIPLLATTDLSPAISVKHVVLQLFPQLLFSFKTQKKRRMYTYKESQQLLDKICELNAHKRVLGIRLFVDLANCYIPNRSSGSLREHFRNRITPHVIANDGYYIISPDDVAKFKDILAKKNPKAKRRKVQYEDDSC